MSQTISLGRRLGGNALAKLGSELVGRVATFGLSLYIANQLGERAFGAYNYGLALGFVLAQIADMGLQVLAARDVAIAGRGAQPLVARALRLKVWLSLPVLALLFLLRDGRPASEQVALLLLGLAMLAQTFLEFAAYVYRGQQRIMREAWLLTVARLLTALFAGAAIWAGAGLPAVGAAYLLAITGTALWGMWGLRASGWFMSRSRSSDSSPPLVRPPVISVGPRARWRDGIGRSMDGPSYGGLIREALPLGIAIFLSIGYTRVAVFMLEYRLGPLAVAEFSAAHRLVEPAQIVPAALLAAVFPAFSEALHRDRSQARWLGWGSSLLLALAGGSAALVFWFGAPWLIPTLYGDAFLDSVPVLQFLGLSALPAFMNYNLTHILIARGQQLYSSIFVAVMLILHSVLTWTFIPVLGAVAPALSVTFAELILLLLCITVLALTRGKAGHWNGSEAQRERTNA